MCWLVPLEPTGDLAGDLLRVRNRMRELLPRVRAVAAELDTHDRAMRGLRVAQREVPGTLTEDRARKRHAAASVAADAAVQWALRTGLEERLGLMLSRECQVELAWLADHRVGAMHMLPSGIAVCERCAIVFEPRRKGQAATCSYCERRHADGPGPVADLVNLLAGRSRFCAMCGDWFEAPRRLCCSDACDRRWRRAGRPPPVPTAVEQAIAEGWPTDAARADLADAMAELDRVRDAGHDASLRQIAATAARGTLLPRDEQLAAIKAALKAA